MAEVTYTYSSATTQTLSTPTTMTNTFYSRPRRVAQISLSACP